MKSPNINRLLTVGFALALVSLIGLSMQSRLSSASSVAQNQTKSSRAVSEARTVLDAAIANEKTSFTPQAAQATEAAFLAYKIAVENRSAEIRAAQEDLKRKEVRPGESSADKKALDSEYDGLQKSLDDYYQRLRALHPALIVQSPPSAPSTVFTGGAITINASASPPPPPRPTRQI